MRVLTALMSAALVTIALAEAVSVKGAEPATAVAPSTAPTDRHP